MIESDDRVLEMAERVLQEEGLEVVATHGLHEAAALLREERDPFDLLVLESDPASAEERRLLRTLRREAAGPIGVLFLLHADRSGAVDADEHDVLVAPFGPATFREAVHRAQPRLAH